MKRATHSIALLLTILFALASLAKATPRMIAPVANVAMKNAVADAQSLASLHAQAQVMKVSGASMHPYFGDGAVIVVKPIQEAKLRNGMVVVYKNRFGETVAHRLVNRVESGWVAKGYNNQEADSTVVNADNLIGVVYATFHTANDGADSKLTVALAAPAK